MFGEFQYIESYETDIAESISFKKLINELDKMFIRNYQYNI